MRLSVLTMFVAVSVAACTSGVSQEEFDEVEAQRDAARSQVAALEAIAESGTAAEARRALAAYEQAMNPVDSAALAFVYAEDVAFRDTALGVNIGGRAEVIADLIAKLGRWGIDHQVSTAAAVGEEGIVMVEWTLIGAIPSTGQGWSFKGVSVMEVRNGLVAAETRYYDLTSAPWG